MNINHLFDRDDEFLYQNRHFRGLVRRVHNKFPHLVSDKFLIDQKILEGDSEVDEQFVEHDSKPQKITCLGIFEFFNTYRSDFSKNRSFRDNSYAEIEDVLTTHFEQENEQLGEITRQIQTQREAIDVLRQLSINFKKLKLLSEDQPELNALVLEIIRGAEEVIDAMITFANDHKFQNRALSKVSISSSVDEKIDFAFGFVQDNSSLYNYRKFLNQLYFD